MNGPRLPEITVGVLILFILMSTPLQSLAECDATNIMNEMFTELKSIGEAGEAQVAIQLDQLSAQKEWNREKAKQLLLEIADSEQTREAEDFRDSVITQMFTMQSKPGLDCAQFAALRDEILQREQMQWKNLLSEIKRRQSL